MTVFLLVFAAAATVGLLLGGRLRGLATVRLQALWLVWAALAVSLLPVLVATHGPLERISIAAACAILCLFLAVNAFAHKGWIRVGFLVVAVGWTLNGAAIVANGGMPVPRSILDRPVSGLDRALDVHRFEHAELSSSTKLPWLADIISTPCLNGRPGPCGAASVGDVGLLGGMVTVEVAAMMITRRRRSIPRGAWRDEPEELEGRA